MEKEDKGKDENYNNYASILIAFSILLVGAFLVIHGQYEFFLNSSMYGLPELLFGLIIFVYSFIYLIRNRKSIKELLKESFKS